MGYAANTGVIIYCNTDQDFSIHGDHHAWFDEYNYSTSMEDKHNNRSLLLQQDTEIAFHI